MKFLSGLDNDIKENLIAQIRNLWTHTSTAIEGNTLTLGETAFVIEEGLTISGKPLKDHQEVIGHAKAIDLIYQAVAGKKDIDEIDLYDLHTSVITEKVVDIYQKPGEWKQEPNGTYTIDDNDKQVYLEYANVKDTPILMKSFNKLLNEYKKKATENPLNSNDALDAYTDLHAAFVRVHPFYDGNGRMARLLANIPVLISGHPPILIPKEDRLQYIRLLGQYQLSIGQPKPGDELVPHNKKFGVFQDVCKEAWKQSLELVAKAHELQTRRGKDTDIEL